MISDLGDAAYHRAINQDAGFEYWAEKVAPDNPFVQWSKRDDQQQAIIDAYTKGYNGFTGGRAVWELYAGTALGQVHGPYGVLDRTGRTGGIIQGVLAPFEHFAASASTDPLTATGSARAVGQVIREGGEGLWRQAAGRALEAPYQVFDAPVDAAFTQVRRGARQAGRWRLGGRPEVVGNAGTPPNQRSGSSRPRPLRSVRAETSMARLVPPRGARRRHSGRDGRRGGGSGSGGDDG